MGRLILLLILSTCLVIDANIIKIVSHNDDVEIDIEQGNGEEKAAEIEDAITENRRRDLRADIPAKPCPSNPRGCKLPHCRCTSTQIPLNLTSSHTPQMIVFSFTNAIRSQDMHLYEELFAGRRNPNHCPVSATFFVSGNWSYFGDVNRLYSQGHEIGNNGVNEETLDYWKNATWFDWLEQMTDESLILSHFADIDPADIRGWRSPFLYMGGERMAWALYVSGMEYDSTRVALNSKTQPNLNWPFTYDYQSTQSCTIGKCPTQSWPGLWENPIEALVCPDGHVWADLASCVPGITQQQAFDTLYNGFLARYRKNKAPLVVQMKIDWLLSPAALAGTKQFLDKVLSYPDVYMVSAGRSLDWVQHPQPWHRPPSAFSCSTPPPRPCPNPIRCGYGKDRKFVPAGQTGYYYTSVCGSGCPSCYPALGDPLGTKC